MKVLHVTAGLSLSRGGPTKVIKGLTEALAEKGVKVSIFAPSDNSEVAPSFTRVDIRLFPEGILSGLWRSYSQELAKTLKKEVSHFDLIHIHEIWHHPHFTAYQAAKSSGRPFIVTTHNTLESWCLSYKGLRKKIYTALIQRRILEQTDGLHAISEKETQDIFRYVKHKNIFCITNGIDLSEFCSLPHKLWFEDSYPELRNKKVILFLGRLHPIKGLDMLSRAFGRLCLERDDVHLLIVGPDDVGYKKEIVRMLANAKALDKTTFTGMLEGITKLGALSRADIFVLPSYSEGFSISVLEAMACNLPVLITTKCNFNEVESVGAGMVIEPDEEALAGSLAVLLDSPELARAMGRKGRRLVLEKYTWDRVAEEMIDVYKQIIHRTSY